MMWDELTEWQKSEVRQRLRSYMDSPGNTPPKPEIYIPIDPRRSPDDVRIITDSENPPKMTWSKAVYRLVKYPQGMRYDLIRIE